MTDQPTDPTKIVQGTLERTIRVAQERGDRVAALKADVRRLTTERDRAEAAKGAALVALEHQVHEARAAERERDDALGREDTALCELADARQERDDARAALREIAENRTGVDLDRAGEDLAAIARRALGDVVPPEEFDGGAEEDAR